MSLIRSVVSGIAGVGLTVLGGVAIVKAGALNFDGHVDALGFHHTGLFGWVELALGLLLLAAAVSWGAGGTAAFLGLLAAAFGLIVLVTGNALHDPLGVHQENGVLYLVLGVLVALFGFLSMSEEPPVSGEGLA